MGNFISTLISTFQMGRNGGHVPDGEHVPDGVTKLNESLYQLYEPPIGVPTEVDVIFFHGLQVGDYRNAYWNTWSSDEGTTAWPRTLLGQRALVRARIMAVSYDSSIRTSSQSGRGELFTIAENLVMDIIESTRAFVGGNQRPVILVGHSLGGLVIKKFLLMTCEMKCDLDPKDEQDQKKIERLDEFIKSVRGVFYYATPHQGSKLADVASKIPGNSEVLIFLQTLSKETVRLNERFAKWRKKNGIKAFSVAERLPTKIFLWGVNSIIVKEASVRYDTDGYYTANADHLTVCKPTGETNASFEQLKKFITENVGRLTLAENPESSRQENESLQ